MCNNYIINYRNFADKGQTRNFVTYVAEDIWEYILGRPQRDFYDYGDALIQEGWIKVTTSGMYFYYAERGFYDVMSEEQWFVYQQWKKKYFGDKY